jgi:putative membrane protein
MMWAHLNEDRMNALAAFLHHLLFITIMVALFAEILLLKEAPTLASARKIRRYDAIYGVAALLVIAVGALRVMVFEKGPGYYMHSAAFMAKMVLFALAGLLSAYPTVTFLKWGGALRQGAAPVIEDAARRRLRLVVHVEAGLMLGVVLCAALMAKGYGYLG